MQTFAKRVGDDLAGQVDLERGVDRDHVVVLGNHERVVGIVRRVHFECRIVVEELEQLMCAGGETADDLAAVQRLVLAGDHAEPGELHHAVGEHLGVDAEIVLVRQHGEDGVGDIADAELERGAIGDQPFEVQGDVAHRLGHLVAGRPLEQRLGVVDELVDLVDMNERVAERARHPLVDLGDDELGRFDRRLRDVDRDAQAAPAVLVRRTDAHQRDVDAQSPRAKQGRHLGQKHGSVVGARLGHGLAHAVADEESVGAEVVRETRVGVGGDAEREHVDDFGVREVLAGADQRAGQRLRFAAGRTNEDAVAGPNLANRGLGRNKF